jgi:tetratricopeptide (TPR) repeat protein
MRFEAQGKLDEAQEVYDTILQEDDTNMLASKRQIALLKARNKEGDMIEALTKYLDTYYDDSEAWLELCDVYLSKHMYDQAAYCCEELILLQPTNHVVYLKYAEILYTLNYLPLAFKHYCKVLELCTDNVRALYGLQLVSCL